MSYTLRVNRPLDEQFVKDVFVTAVEGGIGYWSCLTEVVRDEQLNILSVAGHDIEDEDEVFTCDLNDIVSGLNRVVNDSGDKELSQYILEQDSCMIDAEGADTIFQFAMFGEIVYG